MRAALKSWLFGLWGKEPEAAVVHFLSGDAERARAMAGEVQALVPERRHFAVTTHAMEQDPAGVTVIRLRPGSAGELWLQARRALAAYRIGLAPVLCDNTPDGRALRWTAFWLAPGRLLAFNGRGERHHLRLRTLIASLLFLRGVPLDRIFLRPRWLPGGEPSAWPTTVTEIAGRDVTPGRPRVAVLTPYYPYPLSHGGAVRMFSLLREAAREFDVFLLSFTEPHQAEGDPVMREWCVRQFLFPLPRYRVPRWASRRPPEVAEFSAPFVRAVLERVRREWEIDVVQVEYTPLATYPGDVLVEHDVTFDLYRQIHARERRLATWWDWWRWQRFESRVVQGFRRVVTMSDKDSALLGAPQAVVLPNGVDLARFTPEPETTGERLLFVGSFRHFPNIAAYRFFTEQVWPLLRERRPSLTLTLVAGPDAERHWQAHTGTAAPADDERIVQHGFVADVRPLYVECTLVVVPTTVSAGTNLKVLEAMAMERAVVSTSSGCAGLGLVHGESVWVAETPEAFAAGVERLLDDAALRRSMAERARQHAVAHFHWGALGERQAALWHSLLK